MNRSVPIRAHRRPASIAWANSLPEGWGEPRICQVARMGTGHTPSRARPELWESCFIPWLTTGDVHKFREDQVTTIADTEIHISETGLANSAAVMHPAGTVALSRTASAGFSIIMGRDMATSQDFATWTCGPLLTPRYLLWCLRAMRSDIMGRLAIGSTHKTIYFPDLMSIRIPLPPIEVQGRIADFLDDQVTRIGNIVAAREKQCMLLNECLQEDLRNRWHVLREQSGVSRLAYWLRLLEQGWSPDAEARQAEIDEWAVMRAGCVNGGHFNQADHKALPINLAPRREYELRPGDLLMSRASGSRDLIGSVAVVPPGVRSRLLLPDKIYRLTPLHLSSVPYLFEMLRTPVARDHIKDGISGAEGMANNIPSGVVRSIPVPNISVSRQGCVQRDFSAAWSEIDNLVRQLKVSTTVLNELKRSLITGAVTGRFDVTTADGSQMPA